MNPTSAQRVAKNTLTIIISQIITLFLSFIFIAILARYIGTENYGIYSFAGSFVSLFRIFIDLGLNTLLIRQVARDKGKISYYFSNTMVIHAISSIIVILLITTIVWVLGYAVTTQLVVFLSALILMFENFSWTIFAAFTAYECRENEASVRIIGKIAFIVLGFAGIFLYLAFVNIMILLLVSTIFTLVIAYYVMVTKVARPGFEVSISTWPSLIIVAVPFAIRALLFDVYFHIDMTMLQFLQNSEAVAFYSVAYRFIDAFSIIPGALTGAVWPIMARLHLYNQERVQYVLNKSIQYLLIVSIPLTTGIEILASPAILTFFGQDYANSILALQILCLVLIPSFITVLALSALGAIDKPELAVYSLFTCVVVNVGLNIVMIPQFSYLGAAIATIITEIVLFIQYYYQLSSNRIKIVLTGKIFKPIVGSVFMGIVTMAFLVLLGGINMIVQLVIIVPSAIVTYGAVLLLFRTFDEEDFEMFKDVVGQKNQVLVSIIDKFQKICLNK